MSEIVQATLIFGVIGPLCNARLAEEIDKVLTVLVLTKHFQAAMYAQQMPTVHRLQLFPAIQAIEDHHRLRFHKIAYVADAHKGCFGQPPTAGFSKRDPHRMMQHERSR